MKTNQVIALCVLIAIVSLGAGYAIFGGGSPEPNLTKKGPPPVLSEDSKQVLNVLAKKEESRKRNEDLFKEIGKREGISYSDVSAIYHKIGGDIPYFKRDEKSGTCILTVVTKEWELANTKTRKAIILGAAFTKEKTYQTEVYLEPDPRKRYTVSDSRKLVARYTKDKGVEFLK